MGGHMNNFFEKHKTKLGIICASIILLVGGFFAIPNAYKVFPIEESFELELGSQVDTNISSYIDGLESAVADAQLDISNVDIFTAGDYQIYVNIGKRSIPYDIKIVDTVAPSLSLNPEIKYLAINRDYDVHNFVSEVSDLSNTSDVFFKVNGALQETISLDTVGEHTLTIVAKDISGNETEQSTTISAEIPPRFMGLADATIPVGTDFDYTNSFLAYDVTDGFITSSATIDAPNVDFSQAGTYGITYTVVNSKGIDSSITIYITTSPDVSDYQYTNYLKTEDWTILKDNSYFQYELLDATNSDAEKVVELLKPITVNVSKIKSETDKRAGSAFIYKINEDYIYCLSVNHVIGKMYEDAYFTFHNDVSIKTTVEFAHLGSKSELAIFRIKTSEIPQTTLLTLKEAYIDASYYSEMKAGTPLIEYVENHGFYADFKKVLKKVSLISVNEPNHKNMNFSYPALATTSNLIGGMSGGPIFDYQGRVLGAASYSTTLSKKDFFMKIDTIEELIQIFNEKYPQ